MCVCVGMQDEMHSGDRAPDPEELAVAGLDFLCETEDDESAVRFGFIRREDVRENEVAALRNFSSTFEGV